MIDVRTESPQGLNFDLQDMGKQLHQRYVKSGSLQGEATWLTDHVAPTRSILRLSSTYKQSCVTL